MVLSKCHWNYIICGPSMGPSNILYLRTNGESPDQAGVAIKSRPEPIFLTVDRGEASIVQRETRNSSFRVYYKLL